MKIKYLLYAGIGVPVVFWSTITICAFILGDYNHLSNLVSELGAINTETQFIFTTGLVFCSILSVAFTIGLCRMCKEIQISVIPVIFILFYSVSIAGAALFPMPHRLHGILGMPSILLIFSPLASLILWKGNGYLCNIKVMTILSLLVMVLGFLVFVPAVMNNLFGLKQRFFHVGWTVWFVYLSISFSKLSRRLN